MADEGSRGVDKGWGAAVDVVGLLVGGAVRGGRR